MPHYVINILEPIYIPFLRAQSISDIRSERFHHSNEMGGSIPCKDRFLPVYGVQMISGGYFYNLLLIDRKAYFLLQYRLTKKLVKGKLQPKVSLRSRVARCYEWRSEVKTKRCHGLGVRTVRLES